jgi:hypothetical protein|tara:strand:- start:202 stop:393 length:192 start_codon:yes stop_codon:yes gene_type:complete
MSSELIQALVTIRKIVEDQHKTILDHEKRIGMLEVKLQVYAKSVSGIDLDYLASDSFNKKEDA